MEEGPAANVDHLPLPHTPPPSLCNVGIIMAPTSWSYHENESGSSVEEAVICSECCSRACCQDHSEHDLTARQVPQLRTSSLCEKCEVSERPQDKHPSLLVHGGAVQRQGVGESLAGQQRSSLHWNTSPDVWRGGGGGGWWSKSQDLLGT